MIKAKKSLGQNFLIDQNIINKIINIIDINNKDILEIESLSIGCSDLHMMMSGWIPALSNSLTECWVGFVFNSPAELKYGI